MCAVLLSAGLYCFLLAAAAVFPRWVWIFSQVWCSACTNKCITAKASSYFQPSRYSKARIYSAPLCALSISHGTHPRALMQKSRFKITASRDIITLANIYWVPLIDQSLCLRHKTSHSILIFPCTLSSCIPILLLRYRSRNQMTC